MIQQTFKFVCDNCKKDGGESSTEVKLPDKWKDVKVIFRNKEETSSSHLHLCDDCGGGIPNPAPEHASFLKNNE